MASEAPIGRHLLPMNAAIDDDGLSVAGANVIELVAEYGTPLFIYDEAHLRQRCAEAVKGFGEGAAYGTKAFLCTAMAKLAAEEQMTLDVSTAGEFAVVQAAGVDPSRVVFHGNNKSVEELEIAMQARVHRIVVDSFDEIERVKEICAGAKSDRSQDVLVRVTPGVSAHTHEYVMTGQEDSKFGFSVASGAAQLAVDALRGIDGIEVAGIHAHVGSQIFRLDVFEQAIAVLEPLLSHNQLFELCIGGGLGVAYLNEERAPSITDWAKTIRHASKRNGIDERVTISVEPGRSIVASAALTCYRIGTIKEIPGVRTYVSVDGGMSDNPRPVLYGSGYEAFLARNPNADRPMACRVVGKHCESGDVIVLDARLPADTRVGDVLVTPVTGAYGYSMASNYNRIGRPAVVFVDEGHARLVLRRETTADLLGLEP